MKSPNFNIIFFIHYRIFNILLLIDTFMLQNIRFFYHTEMVPTYFGVRYFIVTNVNPKFPIPSTPHKLINETKELNSYYFKTKCDNKFKNYIYCMLRQLSQNALILRSFIYYNILQRLLILTTLQHDAHFLVDPQFI